MKAQVNRRADQSVRSHREPARLLRARCVPDRLGLASFRRAETNASPKRRLAKVPSSSIAR